MIVSPLIRPSGVRTAAWRVANECPSTPAVSFTSAQVAAPPCGHCRETAAYFVRTAPSRVRRSSWQSGGQRRSAAKSRVTLARLAKVSCCRGPKWQLSSRLEILAEGRGALPNQMTRRSRTSTTPMKPAIRQNQPSGEANVIATTTAIVRRRMMGEALRGGFRSRAFHDACAHGPHAATTKPVMGFTSWLPGNTSAESARSSARR